MVMEEQMDSSGLVSETVPVPIIQNPQPEADVAMVNQDERPTRGGKPRHRKKALHAQILKQMEFYFSDANLSKDRFLANLIRVDPFVDLGVFLQFNKIRTLTQDKKRIAMALKSSTILKLSDDGTKVCRITPVTIKEDVEACTIYAQGLPPDADHDWVINMFSRYGSVAYVSLPRYRTNRKLKGFAFIEFETVDSAEKCLKIFEEKNCTLPLHTAPQELLSITTFSEDDPPPNKLDDEKLGSVPIVQKAKTSKRSAALMDNDNTTPNDEILQTKKSRLNGSEEKTVECNPQESSKVNENVNTDDENDDNDVDEKKDGEKKKKRKRNRGGRAEQPDIMDFGLRIMAKRDWKKLRNKYLELQRSKMKQLKQHLRKTRWGSQDKREKMEVDDESTKKQESATQKNSTPKFSFAEGLIVKIDLDKPCSNPKNFKHEFRNDTGVEYIDVKESVSCAYIRCNSAESAMNLVKKYSEEKTVNILQGDEENAYWKKMEMDREEKLGKRDRTKQRGRDKLLKKAEKELGKHIRFDEV